MFSTTLKPLVKGLLLISMLSACKEKKSVKSPSQKQILKPSNTQVQDKSRAANLDKSPMDIIYFPRDYPVLKMSGKINGLPLVRVIYSRPMKDGRQIFGNVVKYGSYWRLGANEGTEIEFFADVTIMGKKVKKGRYIVYCIPNEDKWTLKLNTDLFTWGLKIHTLSDVYSFDVPAIRVDKEFEVFTMEFSHMDGGAQLIMAWDSVRAVLPIKYQEPVKMKKGSE